MLTGIAICSSVGGGKSNVISGGKIMSFKYKVFSADVTKIPVEVEVRPGKKAHALIDHITVQLVPDDPNHGGTIRLNFEADEGGIEKLVPGADVEVSVTITAKEGE
jgi:hypothetical protein